MSGKTLIRWTLLAFVVVSLGYLGVSEFRKTGAVNPAEAPPIEINTPPASLAKTVSASDENTPVAPVHKVIAYYFHNTQRCKTCLKIERWSHEALKDRFGDRFATGELEWRLVNMEQPPNEHFVQDYGLVTSSLVFVDLLDGEQRNWINMEDVWSLVHTDEQEFKEYVVKQAGRYLESDT